MAELSSNAHSFIAGHWGLVGGALLRRLQQADLSKLMLPTQSEVAP
jgi:hypothetical protein